MKPISLDDKAAAHRPISVLKEILRGPQSVAGGLLVRVSPEKVEMLLGLLTEKGVKESVAVGRVITDRKVRICVRF